MAKSGEPTHDRDKAAPKTARDFAIETVQNLRDSGFQALWAGGCVRDQLLGRTPKDYDVATNATPDQVRTVFGKRRTLMIGEAFGVVAVVGRKPLLPIEVATFRKEAGYSDGRHPDHVAFSSAQEDASRRDFTINGLFFDPIANRVIDYVDGQADIERRIVRCIGDANERFGEDRLRMLRAIRFASTFDFELDAGTLAAVQENAKHIVMVSAERIAAEMRRMLEHANAVQAMELLQTSGLRPYVLPEFGVPGKSNPDKSNRESWRSGIQLLTKIQPSNFALSCAALLRPVYIERGKTCIVELAGRWKLPNVDRDIMHFVLRHEESIRRATTSPWPKLQRTLIQQFARDAIELAQAVVSCGDSTGGIEGIEFCKRKLALPGKELNPDLLVTGDDLVAAGVQPGPTFRTILDTVRDEQLDGRLVSREQAIAFALRMAK